MEVCTVKRLIGRSFTQNLQSTADSFKSWDTCMNNKTCKIVAIVGIVLAALVALWLLGAILTCFMQGVTGIGEFCCWCCNCGRGKSGRAANEGYGRTSQIPPPATVIYQPIQQPESAYYRKADDAFFDERRRSKDAFELEEDFDLEKQREKSRKKRLPAVTHDVDENLSVYQPSSTVTATNPWQAFDPQNRASTHQSPYPYDNVQEYQGQGYYHGGYHR